MNLPINISKLTELENALESVTGSIVVASGALLEASLILSFLSPPLDVYKQKRKPK